MADENFTTYTEVDPNSKITVIASKVSWSDLRSRNVDAYVYKDFGVNFFSGNFSINLTYRQISGSGQTAAGQCWTLANLVDDAQGIAVASGDYLSIVCSVGVAANNKTIQLEELDGGTKHVSAADFDVTEGTDYYLTVSRDEAVGTYGTLTLKVYTDSARTTLVDTQTITLHSSKKDFRYLYGLQSRNTGDGGTVEWDGQVEDLEVVFNVAAIAAPTVTTQAVSSISTTTATGNGNVTALGAPIATQHGHVWATHTNPTTTDSKTEKGVPSATGAYTSNMTGLIANTLYHVRAYIINSVGTFYGQPVTFTTSGSTAVVTTIQPESVAVTTAVGKGSISNLGGSAVTAHGLVWGTSANPDTGDSKTDEGATSTLGDFYGAITELTANTLYHVRAYVINTSGTSYGADLTFTTLVAGVPIVTTQPATDVQPTTATGNATIVDVGGSAVTEHGHCWSTSVNPTTADSKTTNGAGVVGPYTSAITSLTAGTAFYIRPYATNGQGTSYGDNELINQITTIVPPGTPPGSTPGVFGILDENLVWIGASGTQYFREGTAF